MGSPPVASSNTGRLEGKVAIITGGASGIGERTARLFCHHGAKVIIADIQDDKGQDVCKDIGPGVASYVHCDVTDEADVQRAVDTAIERHGRLDVMFNNAGITRAYCPVFDTEKSEFERVMSVNVLGPFLGTKHAARAMVPAQRGSIINAASVVALVGGTTGCPYTVSKHAVVGLTRTTAVELGQFGVRVNCVSPLAVATPLACESFQMEATELEAAVDSFSVLAGVTPKAVDIAEAVLFLASDESRYVNGHNLVVDGGYSAADPTLHARKFST